MSNFLNNFQDIYPYEDYLEFDLAIHLRHEVTHLFIPLGSHRPHRTAYGLSSFCEFHYSKNLSVICITKCEKNLTTVWGAMAPCGPPGSATAQKSSRSLTK